MRYLALIYRPLFLMLLFSSLGSTMLVAQISVEVALSPETTVIGNYFKLEYTVLNASPKTFKPPSFSKFTVVHKESGPTFSIGSGGIVRAMVYTFYLKPSKVGTYTIAPATAVVGKKIYKSKSAKVRVVKAGAPGSPQALLKKIEDGKGLFVVATASTTEPFVGQQVIVDFKIYTSVGLDRYYVSGLPDYPGFFAQEISNYDNQVYTEKVNGETYKTMVLHRMALFPQKSGQLTINPISVDVSINVPGQRRAVREILNSEPLKINVQALPNHPKKEKFCGAIGNYTMNVYARNTSLTTDDAFTIGLMINGFGEVKQINPPVLDFGEHFDVYKPKVNVKEYEDNGMIAGTKTFEYMVVPRKPGSFNVSPEFTYFSPDSLQYITVMPKTIPVNISLGKNPLPDEIKDVEEIEQTRTPKGLMSDITFSKKRRSFLGTIPFWIATFLPFFALGFAGYKKRQQILFAGLDQSVLKKEQAHLEAQNRLTKAKTHWNAQEPRAFFGEISFALWGYISDKLEIEHADLSKSNVREKMMTAGVSDDLIHRFESQLQTCEMALFASKDSAAAMESSYNETTKLIIDIENELTPKEEADV